MVAALKLIPVETDASAQRSKVLRLVLNAEQQNRAHLFTSLCAEAGVSCGQIAMWLGVHRSHAWKLREGVHAPSEEQLDEIRRRLG